MKILILSFASVLLFNVCFASENNISNMQNSSQMNVADMSVYDNMFDSLIKKRKGLSDAQINEIKSPFPKQAPIVASSESYDADNPTGYKLMGIIGNKAKINKSWYTEGEYIGSYKLVKIKDGSVIIANEINDIELKLNQGSKNVIITYK